MRAYDYHPNLPEWKKSRKTNFEKLDQDMIPQYRDDLNAEIEETKTQY